VTPLSALIETPARGYASSTIPYRLRPTTASPAIDRGLDQSHAPLVEALRAYHDADMLPFTVPGHKKGRGIAPELSDILGDGAFRGDIPLAGGLDDLQMTGDLLTSAERLAADAFGAQRTFFGVGGSSLSNQIALLSIVGPDDEVIVARNAHKSTYAALILSGAHPIYVQPCYDADLDVAHGVSAANLAATLDAHPRARAALVVSPTYYGVAADLPALADVCHARGVALLVDEAWAAHFAFHPALPPSAMAAGADLSVTSVHKVLTGFSQSSLINVQGNLVSSERVAQWVGLLGTTSPSALILASIDACRRDMMLHGYAHLERTLALSARARAALAALPNLQVLGSEVVGRPGAAALDATKLVIDVTGTGMTGYAVDAWLRDQWNIAVELSDHRRVLALLTVADDADSVGRLLQALSHLSAAATRERSAPRTMVVPLPALATDAVMTPRAAVAAPSRRVRLADAVGSIAAELLTPYPPGIPIAAPGERITRPMVEYLGAGLAHGMYVTGASDPSLQMVSVVQH